jgi:hypothetical protein
MVVTSFAERLRHNRANPGVFYHENHPRLFANPCPRCRNRCRADYPRANACRSGRTVHRAGLLASYLTHEARASAPHHSSAGMVRDFKSLRLRLGLQLALTNSFACAGTPYRRTRRERREPQNLPTVSLDPSRSTQPPPTGSGRSRYARSTSQCGRAIEA